MTEFYGQRVYNELMNQAVRTFAANNYAGAINYCIAASTVAHLCIDSDRSIDMRHWAIDCERVATAAGDEHSGLRCHWWEGHKRRGIWRNEALLGVTAAEGAQKLGVNND